MARPDMPTLAMLPGGCGQAEAASADFAAYPDAAAAAQALGVELPATVLRSVPSRQLEFLAGRIAARAALRTAGLADPPQLPMGNDRAPVWPRGYVGSITHTAGRAWAVAAPAAQFKGLGIDLERVVEPALARELADTVMTDEDARIAIPGWPSTRLFSLVFSAKESAYKCLAAQGGSELEFHDLCLVAVDPDAGTLRLRLLREGGPSLRPGFELAGGFTPGGEPLRTWAFWPAG